MGSIVLALIIIITCVVALIRPWVGICAYYLLAILGPQYIWWWHFNGLRVSLFVALATLGGVFFAVLKRQYERNFIFNKQNFWMAVLWGCLVLSYFAGSYSGIGDQFRADQAFTVTNTIFLFYFCATLEMNNVAKLKFLAVVFIVSTLYLISWANLQYLSQNWGQFNYGRLMGPAAGLGGDSIYKDENTFAMLFVSGLPLIYYFAWVSSKLVLKMFLWTMIPLGCHAIFLTGSRGGLLGIGVVLVTIILLSKRKFLAFPLLLLFLLFYQWQAGDVMERRSEAIVNIEGEKSAGDRLTAWIGGVQMALENPVTGVGLGKFIVAVPDYIESRKMVSHNTFIQYIAESGIIAGIAYLSLVIIFYINSRKIRLACSDIEETQEDRTLSLLNLACTASFTGLFVCANFLSLNTYEIFFVLMLINNGIYQHLNINHKFENVTI